MMKEPEPVVDPEVVDPEVVDPEVVDPELVKEPEPVGEPAGEPAEEPEPAVMADNLARRLHTALVLADGRIANPNDVPYDPTHLDSEEALTATIDALVESNPGARARQYNGDIGAGTRGNTHTTKVDLISLMRNQ